MARIAHTVEVELPASELKSEVFFNVMLKGQKIGTLKVARGSVTWFERNAKKGKRITWSELAEAIAEHPKGAFEDR
jgi:hypothetical protein